MAIKEKNQVLAEKILAKFKESNKKITFAESCTGGLLSSYITAIPGSSNIFDCSWVTYSDNCKNQLLGVNLDLLQKFGAVSKQVAEAMAEGALKQSSADLAIAITGFAGPTGDKVGLVFIGVAGYINESLEVTSYQYQLEGDREQIREEACHQALELGVNWLFQ